MEPSTNPELGEPEGLGAGIVAPPPEAAILPDGPPSAPSNPEFERPGHTAAHDDSAPFCEGSTEAEEAQRQRSVPVLDVLLDPDATRDPPPKPCRTRTRLSPVATAWLGLGIGMAAMGGVLALALVASRHAGSRQLPASSTPATTAAASSEPASPAASPAPPAVPGPWRVTQLGADADVKLVRGTMERRSFIDALTTAGVPKSQVYRLLAAFKPVHQFEKTRKRDTFVAALRLDTRQVRAFEYETGPTEIFQAREREDGTLLAERLDLHLEQKPIAAPVVVGDDLAGSLKAAGFDPSLLELLEDALEGRMQLSGLHSGARLRIVAEQQTALGVFTRYTDLAALEYLPAGDASPMRVYHFHGSKSSGYFDARGRQPYKGGWRTPVPFARISSRFNLRRMHPVLHVIRPHNGVDFAASTGTPVYAACSGRVLFIGDSGPSGNLVTLQHAGGIITAYAHLSRFAPSLKAGQQVDGRQLIGYVGSTGRSTGPHLHFSAKKNGTYIDPLTLKLDGERVLPKPERGDFESQRAELDQKLDAVLLPPLPEAARAPAGQDGGDPEEQDLGEEDKL